MTGESSYENLTLAPKALSCANHAKLKGKPIRVMWPQRDPLLRKSGVAYLFMKNLDPSIMGTHSQFLSCKFGTLLSCKVTEENGFVQSYSEQSAMAALDHDTTKLYLSEFVKKSERITAHEGPEFTYLYVKNLGENKTKDFLGDRFSQFQIICNVVIMKDGEGASSGFGFANFESPEEAKKAMEALNGMKQLMWSAWRTHLTTIPSVLLNEDNGTQGLDSDEEAGEGEKSDEEEEEEGYRGGDDDEDEDEDEEEDDDDDTDNNDDSEEDREIPVLKINSETGSEELIAYLNMKDYEDYDDFASALYDLWETWGDQGDRVRPRIIDIEDPCPGYRVVYRYRERGPYCHLSPLRNSWESFCSLIIDILISKEEYEEVDKNNEEEDEKATDGDAIPSVLLNEDNGTQGLDSDEEAGEGEKSDEEEEEEGYRGGDDDEDEDDDDTDNNDDSEEDREIPVLKINSETGSEELIAYLNMKDYEDYDDFASALYDLWETWGDQGDRVRPRIIDIEDPCPGYRVVYRYKERGPYCHLSPLRNSWESFCSLIIDILISKEEYEEVDKNNEEEDEKATDGDEGEAEFDDKEVDREDETKKM